MNAETDDKAEETQSSRKDATFWHNQLDCAAKREEKWRKCGDDVQCRYMDDREHYEGGGQFEKRINILWANTELQKGALFAQLGAPDVRRAFPLPGNANKIARTAALVIERALTACNNRYDPDVEIENAVEDNLLPGRGQCWISYTPTLEQVPGENEGDPVTERVSYQDVRFEHVEWKCFRHGNGRSWEDVPWVARELLFTKSDLKDRWGGEIADLVPINQVVDEEHINAEAKKDGSFKRARVWEIWYKPERIRVYVADGYPFELEREDDPYKLESFFPCPRPLYAVKTASSLIPRPEFKQYSDQADELDRINTRIWKLLEKLKYCGIYDGSNEDLDSLSSIGKLQDGEFLPYKNFAALASAGGLAQAFQVRDLAPIAAAIQALAQRAIELIQSIYEVTGISDIMRGSSDPRETKGAQQIKAQFGSGRLQRKQKDVARFVKSLYRMKGEIIAEHFERDQIVQMTGIPLPLEVERQQARTQLKQLEQWQQKAQQGQQDGPEGMPPQQPPPPPVDPASAEDLKNIAEASSWEEVSKVLRSDDRRNYNIDIETDVTAFEDEEIEKQQRVEFMGAMTTWLQSAIPAVQANPSLAPLMKELTMFSVGAFKIGRTLEEAFEDAFEQVKNAPPQPNPDEQKVKAEMEMKKQELEANLAEKQADAKLNAEKHQQDLAAKASEQQLKERQMQLDLAMKEKELGYREREMEMKAQAEAFNMELQQESSRFDQQRAREEHGFKMAQQQYDFDTRRAQDEEALEGAAGASAKQQIVTQVEDLVEQFTNVAGQLTEQQMMIAQALQGISAQQEETQEALTAVVGHMTAPVKAVRDPQTRRIVGVERGQGEAGDLRAMLEKLAAGRQVQRGADNRIEGFA